MPAPRLYLDHNATAPLRPCARAAVLAALEGAGNPSSVHAEGRAARALIEDARDVVAAAFGVPRKDVVFTSGGTEAANLALHLGVATLSQGFNAPQSPRARAGATEHACILQTNAHESVEPLPVDGAGRIDLEALAQMLAGAPGRPAVVAVQAANNETGVLQPVTEAARLTHDAGGLLVCDAVQAAGRLPLSRDALGADLLIISAHKFGGPKGVGALIINSERVRAHAPLICGGGQEMGRRGGTENVAGIAGFGAALREAQAGLAGEPARLAALRARLEILVLEAAPDAVIFGAAAERLPNTSCFAVPGLSAETLLIALDLAGVAASSGAACSSGKVKQSYVLAAMGVAPALARGALRLSLGWSTTDDEIGRFGVLFADTVTRARRARAAA